MNVTDSFDVYYSEKREDLNVALQAVREALAARSAPVVAQVEAQVESQDVAPAAAAQAEARVAAQDVAQVAAAQVAAQNVAPAAEAQVEAQDVAPVAAAQAEAALEVSIIASTFFAAMSKIRREISIDRCLLVQVALEGGRAAAVVDRSV